MQFKVGDRVKLCSPMKPPKWKYRDVIGVITNISEKIRIVWDMNGCVLCGDNDCIMRINMWSYWPNEIEKVATKGQQLLFSFME